MRRLLTARNAVLEAIAAIDGVDPGGERFNELRSSNDLVLAARLSRRESLVAWSIRHF